MKVKELIARLKKLNPKDEIQVYEIHSWARLKIVKVSPATKDLPVLLEVDYVG